MAIKAGQILHAANSFVIDRIQTGGPGTLNIPQDRIYELGNYQSVGIVRDIPDLTFDLECLDVDTEVEALLCGSANPATDPASTKYNLANSEAIDIVSPWKSPFGQFAIVRGVAIPFLALESASYRYGLTDNAGETFSLRGDSIYYVPAVPYQDLAVGDGIKTAYDFVHGPALEYIETGVTYYALSVSVDHVRLTPGTDYAETATGVAFTTAPDDGVDVSICYASAVAETLGQSVHEGLTVKPAAIRGKNINVYFSTIVGGNPVEVRWPDVQSVQLDWKVTLDSDFEFGNAHAVNRDYLDVPDVTGQIELKPRSVEAFFARLQQITGVADNQVIGPQSSVAGALRVELTNPDSGGTTAVPPGTVLKTHYVPAARFTIPGYSGQPQQKLTVTVNFESDDGVLETYKGVRA